MDMGVETDPRWKVRRWLNSTEGVRVGRSMPSRVSSSKHGESTLSVCSICS